MSVGCNGSRVGSGWIRKEMTRCDVQGTGSTGSTGSTSLFVRTLTWNVV